MCATEMCVCNSTGNKIQTQKNIYALTMIYANKFTSLQILGIALDDRGLMTKGRLEDLYGAGEV